MPAEDICIDPDWIFTSQQNNYPRTPESSLLSVLVFHSCNGHCLPSSPEDPGSGMNTD